YVDGEDTAAVARGDLAGDVGAEEVAGHGVAARVVQVDTRTREVLDDQASHRRTAGGEEKAVLVVVQKAAVQDDLELSVVGAGGRVDRGPWLRVAVDGQRLGEGRQGGRRLDGVYVRLAGQGGDGEHDPVAGCPKGVGQQNRLAQRALR